MISWLLKLFKIKHDAKCLNCNGKGYVKTPRGISGWVESTCGCCYGAGKINKRRYNKPLEYKGLFL